MKDNKKHININSTGNPDSFKVPEGYFDSLPDQILEKVSSKVSMDVPDGYFDTLPDQVLQQTVEKKSRLIPLNMVTRVAAIFIIGALASMLVFSNMGNESDKNIDSLLANVTPEEALLYLENSNTYITDYISSEDEFMEETLDEIDTYQASDIELLEVYFDELDVEMIEDLL